MDISEKEIVEKFITAYNSFDIDSMLKWLHPEVKFKNISGGDVNSMTSGIEEFELLARQSSYLFKERQQKIVSMVEAVNKINVEIKYRAVLAVDLPNGLKVGDSINLNGKSEYIFKDDLIYSITDES
jgi:hypothetical protein